MRAATRKRGHYTKRGLPVPPATMVHVIEMLRRRTMQRANSTALLEQRIEYGYTLDDMFDTNEVDPVEYVGLKQQVSNLPLWREQKRHGTTGKLIPLRKEFPNGTW